MARYPNAYQTEDFSDNISNKYLFISIGKTVIVKAIEYQFVEQYHAGSLYNLAFGDYDLESGQLNDLSDSNNGDHYAVFNTVLGTIPAFFESNPDATMMVQGSDTKQEYVQQCMANCNKGCVDNCKNTERRINAYRYYVDKNCDDLIKEYEFEGGLTQIDGTVKKEGYVKDKKYDTVFCKKRIILRHGN